MDSKYNVDGLSRFTKDDLKKIIQHERVDTAAEGELIYENGEISVKLNVGERYIAASDLQHGTRSGGNLHPTATISTAGFMSSSDKSFVSGLSAGTQSLSSLTVDGTAQIDALTLTTGSIVNEFSIDGTLSGDSDVAVPTEKAVKTYVDLKINGLEYQKAVLDIHLNTPPGSPTIGDRYIISYSTLNILDTISISKTIVISGNYSSIFATNNIIKVKDAITSGVNGQYTISSVNYDGTNTNIITVENINTSHADGKVYYSGGSWASFGPDEIAEWNGTTWVNDTDGSGSPNRGWAVWVSDENALYVFNSTNWVKFGSTILHNNLNSIQGGANDDYYHLTNSQLSGLTGGSSTSLHNHSTSSITSGNLDIGRMPTGGTWSLTSNLTVSGTYTTGLTEDVGIGGDPSSTVPSLRRCTINSSTGAITTGAGPDLMLNGTDDTSPDQQFIASKVWNSTYNDIADFQSLGNSKLVYGKCYYQGKNGMEICDERMKSGVMGIASNTFGYGLGITNKKLMVPIAIGGWVLAYVDKEYKPGTPLTNDADGNLTEMTLEEKRNYPERLIAIYARSEKELFWGPEGKEIEVNGRHWVKVN